MELTENASDEISSDSYRSDCKMAENVLFIPMDCESINNIEDASGEKNTWDDLASNPDRAARKNNVESKVSCNMISILHLLYM